MSRRRIDAAGVLDLSAIPLDEMQQSPALDSLVQDVIATVRNGQRAETFQGQRDQGQRGWVYERARDGSPFSNGTMGEIWMARWCDRCLRDAPYRNGLKGALGCPILATALCGKTPAEWREQPESEVVTPTGYDVANLYHCTEFREPGTGNRTRRPRKPPPNMESLFA